MERNPILHVNLASLELIFTQLGLSPDLAIKVLEVATKRKMQLKDRYYVVASNAKTKRKIERTIETEEQITDIFNRILTIERKNRNPRSPAPAILPNTKDYLLLKEVAQLAKQFAEDWNIEPLQEGLKKYITVGMDLMEKKYALNKFKYYHPKIYDYQECERALEEDSDTEGSAEFFRTYVAEMKRYSTAQVKIQEMEYLHIIYARQEADEAGAEYSDWITAQFEEMSFMNAMPELYQLYGQNAKRRYEKYSIKQGIRKKPLAKEQVYSSPAQAEYYRRLRDKRANEDNNR